MLNPPEPHNIKCIGIVSPWPKVKNAEYEVIERMKIVLDELAISHIVIDSQGEYVSGPHKKLDDQVNFVISMHYISPKLWSNFTYLAIWNPVKFYHDADYLKVMSHVESYDDYLRYYSPQMSAHLENFLKGTNKLLGDETEWVAGCSGPVYEPSMKMLEDPRIFYCGINWEKISKKKGRHHEILKLLDNKNAINLYGPQKFEGVRPWEGYNNYKGDIPFDGVSVIKELHNCGVSLVLSSDNHRKSTACSSRIYEASHAGAVIISDRNHYVEKVFGDRVLYFEYGTTDEETYENILKQLNWIKANKQKAVAMAKSCQELYLQHFSMKAGLVNIFSRHESRVQKFKQQHARTSGAKVEVLIPWDQPTTQGINNLVTQFKKQDYQNKCFSVCCDHGLKEQMQVELEEAGIEFKISTQPIFYDSKKRPNLTKAQLFSYLYENSKADYVCAISTGQYWFRNHLSTMATILEGNGDCDVATTGTVLIRKNKLKGLLYNSLNNEIIYRFLTSDLNTNYFPCLLRRKQQSNEFESLMSILDEEYIKPYIIQALIKSPPGCTYSSTYVFDEGSVQNLDTIRMSSNLIDDIYRRSEVYTKLIQRHTSNLALTVNYHNIRRVVIDHFANKLMANTKLYEFSKRIYKKFIVPWLY